MLLLSIKPKYVNKMRAGEKVVELRKQKPRSEPLDWMAIYECSPTMAIVAIAQVSEVAVGNPKRLWRELSSMVGVNKVEFDTYFSGAAKAVGIRISKLMELSDPISLDDFRERWPGFHPPQGFVYLDSFQVDFLMQRVDFPDQLVCAIGSN
ncbi:hypothetical protein [Calycomorphotria hydatis]|uniref:ASCH domain-containing protein n=1 Tax=Calycomorphotria hydatis TaxID=2528027 RepID=A0A517TB78_9PLAN|nr:hypothetical protein [Calycomorphotria hydatis]QDT65631.1 hypothetical protein V22_28890 [Calycomorphotria hydatis]